MPDLLLWCDSICSSTGFARAAKSISAALPNWQITQVGINHPSALDEHHHVKVIPAPADNVWGDVLAKRLYAEHNFDLLIVVQDLHVIAGQASAFEQLKAKRKLLNKAPIPILFYYVVDGPTLDHREFFDVADLSISATTWGSDAMEKDHDVIPYAVDTDIFYRLPDAERGRLRQSIFGISSDDPTLAVLSVGVNAERKDHYTSLRAVKLANAAAQTSKIYMHASDTAVGASLTQQARALEMTGMECRFADKSLFNCGDEAMNMLYNSADILLNTAKREGFGVPVVEAMAAGTAVLVPNYGPFVELTESGRYGMLHKTHGLIAWMRGDTRGASWQSDPVEISTQLRGIYSTHASPSGFLWSAMAEARDHAVKSYSAPVVQAQWKSCIEGLVR